MEFLPVLVLALVVSLAGSVVFFTLRLGISPMPSSRRAVRALLSVLPEALEGEVHELGAGWGTLAFALADRFPRAQVVAWELSWVPFSMCWLRQRLAPRSNLLLRRGDFFAHDFCGASAVVCYLYTGAMERLGPKLARELPASAAVVSQTFALRGWLPEHTLVLDDLYRTRVYRYTQGPAPQPAA